MPVFKLKGKSIDNPWYFSCYATVGGVRKKIKRRGFATRYDATIAEQQFLNNYDGSGPRGNMLISVVLKEYLHTIEHNYKSTTFYELGVILKRVTIDVIGDRPVSTIKDAEKKDIINVINNPSRTYKYNMRMLYDATQFFDYMVNNQILSKNILQGVTLKKRNETTNKSIKFWTKDQFNQYISVVNDSEWELFYRLLFITGMRAGEIQALQFKDINEKNKSIIISKTLSNKSGHGHFQLISPKTEGSRREVLLPDWIYDEILSHIGNYPDANKDSFLFGITKPWSSSHILRTTRQYTKEADVPYIGIRGLRHSMASLLVSEEVNIMAISDRLGHKRVSTTLDTYSHMYKSKQLEALKKLTK